MISPATSREGWGRASGVGDGRRRRRWPTGSPAPEPDSGSRSPMGPGSDGEALRRVAPPHAARARPSAPVTSAAQHARREIVRRPPFETSVVRSVVHHARAYVRSSLPPRREVPFGTYDGVLMTKDFTPLDPAVVENKFYARGVGPSAAHRRVWRFEQGGAPLVHVGRLTRVLNPRRPTQAGSSAIAQPHPVRRQVGDAAHAQELHVRMSSFRSSSPARSRRRVPRRPSGRTGTPARRGTLARPSRPPPRHRRRSGCRRRCRPPARSPTAATIAGSCSSGVGARSS